MPTHLEQPHSVRALVLQYLELRGLSITLDGGTLRERATVPVGFDNEEGGDGAEEKVHRVRSYAW